MSSMGFFWFIFKTVLRYTMLDTDLLFKSTGENMLRVKINSS